MSYPPYPPDPNRPQDTPRDQPGQQPGQYSGSTPPPNFPTYGRPQQPPQPQPNPQYQMPPQYPPYPVQQYPAQYGYGYGYGYGYPGLQQVKTNGLATAALVCGLVGIFISILAPVAIGLGIGALVQIKRRRESGTAQAVIGLSLGSLITVVFAALVAFFVVTDWNGGTDNDYGSDQPVSTSSATPDPTYVDELIVGECFDDGYDEGEVDRQPCPVDHDAELIANVTLPAGAYPGDAKVKESARLACRQEFTKYIGVSPDKSVRKSSFWWPDEDIWNDGDRVVVCAAYGPDGDKLHGSVKGTKH